MKVMNCSKCGSMQLSNAIYSFKCKKCERIINIKKARTLFFGSFVECSAFMNKKRHEAVFVNYKKREDNE